MVEDWAGIHRLGGVDLVAIQQPSTCVGRHDHELHVHGTHVQDAWVAGQQRAAGRLKRVASM
jgi:integrase/recombinase XerD